MTNSNYLIRHVLTEVNWSQLSKWTKSQKHLVKSILNCLTNLLWVRNIPLAYLLEQANRPSRWDSVSLIYLGERYCQRSAICA